MDWLVPFKFTVLVVDVKAPELDQLPATFKVLLPADNVPAEIVRSPPVTVPVNERVPAPPFVMLKAPPLRTPLKVKVPASDPMEALLPKVMAPEMELVPEMFLKAPPEAMPVPLRVRASAPTVIPPWVSRAAPLETVVPFVVLPKAEAF